MEKFEIITGKNNVCTAVQTGEKEYRIDLKWDIREKEDGNVLIKLFIPCVDIECAWQPTILAARNINLKFFSMLSASAPVLSYLNNSGNSVFLLALSEIRKRIDYDFAVVEETAMIEGKISIDLKQFEGMSEYSFYIYIDETEMPLYEGCAEIRDWWRKKLNLCDSRIPEHAFLPMYSTWYSFHQHFTADELERECVLAKSMGMSSVIVDDGWQTDDVSRGYAYCGDWEVCASKIADMKEHVQKVHKAGLKYILWYSVPFVGKKSRMWNTFKGKFLKIDDGLGTGVLDPRYKDVREYLIGTYKKALTEWDLDGFKLDFIDNFTFSEDAPANEDMDFSCVQDAVYELMSSVKRELSAIKPDIMIEFRQGYIGPGMCEFGNMFRVVDCSENYTMNRICTVDLRMLSRNVAVHSDMLMWNENESTEGAALMILNVMFSVIQFSMRIENLKEEHIKMSRFWLGFAKENRALLLESKFAAYEPQHFYPLIKAYDEKAEIIGVYEDGKIVRIDQLDNIKIINAKKSERIYIETDFLKEYNVLVRNCEGEITNSYTHSFNKGVCKIDVPKCGIIELF